MRRRSTRGARTPACRVATHGDARLFRPTRFLLAALCTSFAFSQTLSPPEQSARPLFATSADVAQIDALVTNAQGLAAPDLTAADFEILRNNQPQKILSAAYVRNPRTVLLVVDDLSLSLDAINAIRATLAQFVDVQMQPGDRAAIIRTGEGSGTMQTFSAAKDSLHAAIDRVKCHPARIAGGLDEQTEKDFTAGSRAALLFAVGGLRQLAGRKAVVVLSGNLAMFRNAVESAVRLVDSANQAGAVLYGIDPNANGAPTTAASFMVVAEQTGGAVIAPEAGLSSALDRVLQEQDGYYLIDFHPEASLTPTAEKLTVRVKRQALLVRSRTGSIVKPAEAQDTSQQSRRRQMLQAIIDPFSAGDIRVRLTSIFTNSVQGSQIEALSYIDARDLGFIHYRNGIHRSGLDVAVLVCAEDGRVVQENSRSFSMDLSAEDYQRAQTHGLVVALNVPLRLPGPYQVRVIVGDGITGKLGLASQFLEAPDANGKQFSLSSILLMGEKSTSPLSRPPGVQLDITNENPAVRVFNPGQTITYGYAVLNCLAGADKKPALETQTRLFLNGRLVFEGKPTLLAVPASDDPKRHAVGGIIRLSSSMEPGDYVFYVTVADKLAPDQPRKVTQAADFRIER